jgi:hypothetical protein
MIPRDIGFIGQFGRARWNTQNVPVKSVDSARILILLSRIFKEAFVLMNRRWLWIVLGVIGFFGVLFAGAVAGAGITYLVLQNRSERAAIDFPFRRFGLPDSGRGDAPFFHGPFEILPFGQDIPELPEGVEQAVIVSQVSPDSPADQAGLQRGDLITAVDGEEISETVSLAELVQANEPGDEITLTVYRSGVEEQLEIQATLGEHPDEEGQAYLGVTVAGFSRIKLRSPNLPERFRNYFEFPWPNDPLKPEPGPEA